MTADELIKDMDMKKKSDNSIVGKTNNELTLTNLPKDILNLITTYISPTNYAIKLISKDFNRLMQNSLRKTEEYFAQKFPHEFTKIKGQLPAFNQLKLKKSLKLIKNLMNNLEINDFYDYITLNEKIAAKQKNKELLDEQEKIFLEKNANIDVPLLFKSIKSGDVDSIIKLKNIGLQELNYLYETLDSHNLSFFDWIGKMNKQEVFDHFISPVEDWCLHLRTEQAKLGYIPPEYRNFTNSTLHHWYIILQQPPKKHIANSKKEDFIIKNTSNETTLHMAARNRKLDWLIALYKLLGIDSLKEIDNRGFMPLHTAASVGNMNAVKFLLDQKALTLLNDIQIKKLISLMGTQLNMRHKSNTCITPWHIITEYLPAEKLDYFINQLVDEKEHEINEIRDQIIKAQSEITAHEINSEKSKNDLQEKQKELNVLLNCKLPRVETEFHLLQSHIQDINCQNPQGATALHIATKLGDASKIEILLKNGADPYIADADGLTPVHLAAKLKDPGLLDIFIRFGTNVNTLCKNGMPPFLYAVQEGNIQGMKLFISQKISLGVTNIQGETALHIAIKNNQIEALNFSLELELDIDKPTKEGMTPLMCAVVNNNRDAVKLLISKGAKSGFSEMDELLKLRNMEINIIDNEGNSPLHWAVVNQYTDIIKFLLKNGCRWDSVNKKGYTPAEYVGSKDKFLSSVFTLKEYIEKLNKECTSKTAGKSGFFKGHRNPNDKLEAALALEKVIIYGEEPSTLNKYINILTKGTLKKILHNTNMEIEKIEQAEMKI